MQSPSLLDWLRYHLGQPRHQRLLRFGLAVLVALWGISAWAARGRPDLGALLLLAAAGGLFAWGLATRGGAAGSGWSALQPPAQPLPEPGAAPPPGTDAVADVTARDDLWQWLSALRLPSAVLLALVAQATLIYSPDSYRWGLLLYGLGVATFLGTVLYDRLLGSPRPVVIPAGEAWQLDFHLRWLGLAIASGAVAFAAASGNQFRLIGVLAWIISVAAWLAAVWDLGESSAAWWQRAKARLETAVSAEGVTLRLTRGALIFLLVLAVGAYFRFAQLDAIPPEMTSDHVEKLFDVQDVLDGKHYVFFERNTGREPLQFYFAALIIRWLDTGVTHLTLKITGAVAGLLMLPFVYLLGRELEDRRLGLLAMLLAGFSFWATAISRVGLRFPLSPLFVAPVLFFLLRGLRRGGRNDFLLAGLFLGAGLYGYSTIRVLPIVVAAWVAWWLLWPQPMSARRRLLANTILLFATTFIVFLPLYRYALEEDSAFWYRSLSRLSDTEQSIQGSPLSLFLQNNWNALLMFNWRGDEVWVNTIPNLPVLDFITGALFVLGVAFLLARLLLRRDRAAGVLLLAVPLLLLPSTLSLAFPDENPSVVRTGGAIPLVFLMAAYPAWLLLRRLPEVWPTPAGRWGGWILTGSLLALAFGLNHQLYFERYPAQYLGPAQNASEIGRVVRGYASSIGSIDRVYMCLHPHWADTRAVGIYAGKVGWEQVLPAVEFAQLRGEPGPLLVVVNPRSEECRGYLPEYFPTGSFIHHNSTRGADKDFLLFFVPPAPEPAEMMPVE